MEVCQHEEGAVGEEKCLLSTRRPYIDHLHQHQHHSSVGVW